jgi:hypothetical protein
MLLQCLMDTLDTDYTTFCFNLKIMCLLIVLLVCMPFTIFIVPKLPVLFIIVSYIF